MPGLNGIDYGIIAIIGLSGLVSLTRGLIQEIFSLVAWGLAAWVAFRYGRELAGHLEAVIALPALRLLAAYALLFVACLVAAGVLAFLLNRLVKGVGLGGTDRLAGLVFGLARGVVLVSVLLLAARATPLPEDRWWKESKLIPPFQSLALWLRDRIPPDYASRFQSSLASHR